MKELAQLFFVFFRIGITTFGGGLAMLPILTRELETRRGWCTEEEITDYYAVGQCTPGIIAVNVSTFIGMKRRGVAGAVAATFGMIAPSLLIITVIAALVSGFADNVWVRHALAGIRAAVCGLIAVTVLRMIKKNIRDIFGAVLALCALLLIIVFRLSPVIIVLGAGAAGLIKSALTARAMKAKSAKPPADGGKKNGKEDKDGK